MKVGRGDGEVGERLAKESEEQGDLVVGDLRWMLITKMMTVLIDEQRGVPQHAAQVPPGSPVDPNELQVCPGPEQAQFCD